MALLSAMADLEQRTLATVVYPHKALCGLQFCRVEKDGRALYADDNHLTVYGADVIKSILAAAF